MEKANSNRDASSGRYTTGAGGAKAQLASMMARIKAEKAMAEAAERLATGDVEVFHGTTDELLGSIMEQGILVSPPRRNFTQDYYARDRGRSVYVTKDFRNAVNYAATAKAVSDAKNDAPGYHTPDDRFQAVVLTVHVPRSVWKESFVRDRADPEAAFRGRVNIDPSWIVDAGRVLNPYEGTTEPLDLSRFRKEDGELLYLVYILDTEDVAKANPYRGKGGRFTDAPAGSPSSNSEDARRSHLMEAARSAGVNQSVARRVLDQLDEKGATVFHGTVEKNLNAILKEGLVARPDHNFGGSLYWGDRGSSVFVTEDEDEALFYASSAVRYAPPLSRPVVLTLHVPLEALKDFSPDEADNTALRTRLTIRPEWIVEAREPIWRVVGDQRQRSLQPLDLARFRKAGFKVFYVVILVEPDSVEKSVSNEAPLVYFGSPDDPPVDWRKASHDTPDNDEPLDRTPDDVIALLGFDPLEFEKANPNHDELGRFAAAPGGAAPPAPAPLDVVNSPIWERAKDSDYMAGSHGWGKPERGDELLGDLFAMRGFDAKPLLVDDVKTLSDEEYLPDALYRGVEGEGYAEAFRTGELFPGRGIYGNGTYAVTDRNRAKDYARAAGSAGVIEMRLRADARVVKEEDLRELRYSWRNEHLDRVMATPIEARFQARADFDRLDNIMRDDGRFATYLGYDAIRPRNEPSYMVILNRGAVAVSRAASARLHKELKANGR